MTCAQFRLLQGSVPPDGFTLSFLSACYRHVEGCAECAKLVRRALEQVPPEVRAKRVEAGRRVVPAFQRFMDTDPEAP